MVDTAPKRGSSRKQRAVMISEEVKMLQRDHPSPSFGEADPNTLRPPGAGKTVDPEAAGIDVPPGRMGENDMATREGPAGRGVGRVVARDEDVPDTSNMARGVRTPHDAVEEPASGGTSVLAQEDTGLPTSPPLDDEAGKAFSETFDLPSDASSLEMQTSLINELLDKFGPATLAGNGAAGVVQARLRSIADAGIADGDREISDLARRLLKGNIVRFESREERAAAEWEAKQIQQDMFMRAQQKKKTNSTGPPSNPKFAPLSEKVRRSAFEELVGGQIEGKQLLGQKSDAAKTPPLEIIGMMALKNDTYTTEDRERFVAKVQSLLPASMLAGSAAASKQPRPATAKATP